MKFFLDMANLGEIRQPASFEVSGAHIGTVPCNAFEQLFKHPPTHGGLEGLLKDWEKARATLGDVFEPTSARNPSR
jgi:hypothetical protein